MQVESLSRPSCGSCPELISSRPQEMHQAYLKRQTPRSVPPSVSLFAISRPSQVWSSVTLCQHSSCHLPYPTSPPQLSFSYFHHCLICWHSGPLLLQAEKVTLSEVLFSSHSRVLNFFS